MRQKLLFFCYRFLEIIGLLKLCSLLFSLKLNYPSKKTFKEEFENSYLMVITNAKSSLLFNKTVGSVYLQSGYWELDNFDYCVLRSLWVHPLLKRRGVAARLVSEVINNAQSLGFKNIVLTCEDENYAAQRLYQKCGFQLLKDGKEYTRFDNERTYIEEISHRNNHIYWMKLDI